MRVHHLDCGRLRMLGGRLIDRQARGLRADMACHVLALEDASGDITLVDTGLGEQAILRGHAEWFGTGWSTVFAPQDDPALTVRAQLHKAGLYGDVRHIILTHMDLDHAGGLADFPEATVHVHRPELDGQLNPCTMGDRNRYRRTQFEHDPKWSVFDLDGGDDWFGFRGTRNLPGVPAEVRVIGLGGHSNGHVGVAVEVGDHWVLHAGDAYYLPEQIDPVNPRSTLGISMFESFANANADLRIETQTRLRGLQRDHGDRVKVFCAHSMAELRAFTEEPAALAV